MFPVEMWIQTSVDTEVREGFLRTEGRILPALDITKVLPSG